MGLFLRQINASWPHRDHLFVNVGQPGMELDDFARHSCVAGLLPDAPVDLLLVGHHQHRGSFEHNADGRGLEEAVHAVRSHTPPQAGGAPMPVVVLPFPFLVEPILEFRGPGQASSCVSNTTLCEQLCADGLEQQLGSVVARRQLEEDSQASCGAPTDGAPGLTPQGLRAALRTMLCAAPRPSCQGMHAAPTGPAAALLRLVAALAARHAALQPARWRASAAGNVHLPLPGVAAA